MVGSIVRDTFKKKQPVVERFEFLQTLIAQDRHDEQSLDRIRAVSRSTLRDISTSEMSKKGSPPPYVQMFDSGLAVTLHAPVHSTLHVGISLLRLMQPVPLEERNRHNVPAHGRQQPITQAGVAERLQCIPGEV